MTQQALPTADPAAQGVDASGVHAFLDALEADPDIEPHGLTIVRHGHVVASGTWAPTPPSAPTCCTRSARASPRPPPASPRRRG